MADEAIGSGEVGVQFNHTCLIMYSMLLCALCCETVASDSREPEGQLVTSYRNDVMAS